MEGNLYVTLKNTLQELLTKLSEEVAPYRAVVQNLAALVPEIKKMIDEVLPIFDKIKEELGKVLTSDKFPIDKIKPAVKLVESLLSLAKDLLPKDNPQLSETLVLASTTVKAVVDIPDAETLRTDTSKLLDDVKKELALLTAPAP